MKLPNRERVARALFGAALIALVISAIVQAIASDAGDVNLTLLGVSAGAVAFVLTIYAAVGMSPRTIRVTKLYRSDGLTVVGALKIAFSVGIMFLLIGLGADLIHGKGFLEAWIAGHTAPAFGIALVTVLVFIGATESRHVP